MDIHVIIYDMSASLNIVDKSLSVQSSNYAYDTCDMAQMESYNKMLVKWAYSGLIRYI